MIQFVCRALLFDLDGTLANSLPAVDRAWGKWAERHAMDLDFVLSKIHGRRSIDSIRDLGPELDAEMEDAWIRDLEASDTEGVTAILGAVELIRALPSSAYAIVTSGGSPVAHARLKAIGLEVPAIGVYGEDVVNGKPAPDPYLLAAELMGVEPADCLVFEDTPAGVRSGKAAGMRVIAVASWVDPLELAGADIVVTDFRSIGYRQDGDQAVITVRQSMG